MKYFILLFLPVVAFAQSRSSLYKKPEVVKVEKQEAKTLSPTHSSKKSPPMSAGNLDGEILVRVSRFRAEENPVLLPTIKTIELKDFKVGEVVTATIPESLIAFPDSKVPVRALITSGRLKNSVLVGEAALEKNSKRIIIEFKKLRIERETETIEVKAVALDQNGVLGIEGDYKSGEGKYFAAELLAAGAAGYADATIERSQNILGNSVEAPTSDTVSKKALSSALSKTAERFAEKVKSAPEYSVVKGPVSIQILLSEVGR